MGYFWTIHESGIAKGYWIFKVPVICIDQLSTRLLLLPRLEKIVRFITQLYCINIHPDISFL